MDERSYCIVVVDNTTDIEQDVTILTGKPVQIILSENGSMAIIKFKSDLNPHRIKKMLNIGDRRTFFLFELNAKNCAIHIDDEGLHNFLFKDFEIETERLIEDENRLFIKNYKNLSKDFNYNEDTLLGLSEEDREKLIDDLLNNAQTLTNDQKKALSFLININ